MAVKHVVQQGDHLPAIAESFGIRYWRTIWEHPDNAELRAARKEPTLLMPGDVVAIPEKADPLTPVETGRTHTFKLGTGSLKLRLRVLDPFGEPVANSECQLEIDGKKETVTTDEQGMLEKTIPAKASVAVLQAAGMEFPLKIGHLDPLPSPTGMEARLINLGFYPGSVGEDDADSLAFAAELFQHDNGLAVTGVLAEIAEALAKIYGC